MTTADIAKEFTAALKAGKFEDAERSGPTTSSASRPWTAR